MARLRRLGHALAWATAVAALVHPAAMLTARRIWLADLLAHFREPALALSLIAAAALFAARRRRLAAALAVLAVVQAVPLFRYEGRNPVAPDPRSTARLRLLMANVLVLNRDPVRLARLIERERPDVVGLVEVSQRWLWDLHEVREQFPYRMEWPAGASGLALWCRERPLRMNTPDWPVVEGFPFVHALIDFAGRPTHLWLVHASSPLRRTWQAGNPELDAIAEAVAQADGPRIVIGDMNSTDASPHFRDFLDASGLRDSRLGFGRQPSWPLVLPYRLALDHAFVSDDLAVVDRRLGPSIGSDHRPLIVELAPASAAIDATSGATSASQASRSP